MAQPPAAEPLRCRDERRMNESSTVSSILAHERAPRATRKPQAPKESSRAPCEPRETSPVPAAPYLGTAVPYPGNPTRYPGTEGRYPGTFVRYSGTLWRNPGKTADMPKNYLGRAVEVPGYGGGATEKIPG